MRLGGVLGATGGLLSTGGPQAPRYRNLRDVAPDVAPDPSKLIGEFVFSL